MRQESWNTYEGDPDQVYDTYLVPAIYAPWAVETIWAADLQPGEQVLDVACGSGVVTRLAAERVGPTGRTVGLDLSASMLVRARATPAETRIEWYEGDAQTLPFSDATFDVVLCQHGLTFFADRAAALREMYRVLRPSGRLVVTVFGRIERSPGYAELSRALVRYVGPEAGLPPQYALGDPDLLRDLVASAGFREVMVRHATLTVRFPSPLDFILRLAAGSIVMRRLMASLDAGDRAAVLDEAITALEPYTSENGFAFPQEGNLATAIV